MVRNYNLTPSSILTEYLSTCLKVLVLAYFNASGTKYMLKCDNTHNGSHLGATADATAHDLPYLCSCGFRQSMPRKMNATPRLSAWQTPADSVPTSFVSRYFSFQSSIFFEISKIRPTENLCKWNYVAKY